MKIPNIRIERTNQKHGGFMAVNVSAYWKAFCFLIFALCFSCTTSGKEEKDKGETKDEAKIWYITIRGKVSNPQEGQIVIQELKDNASAGWQDTIQLKSDQTFVKKIKLSEPGYYRLSFFKRQVLNIILDKNDLEVNVDGSDPQGFYEVKGSPDLELIKKVQEMLAAIETLPELKKLNEDFTVAVGKKDQEKIAQLQSDYQVVVGKEHDKIAKLIEQGPPSLAVINLLQANTLDKDKYFKTYLIVADKLRSQWPDYTQSKAFVQTVDKMKALAIGQPAPEISLPNPDGQIVKLSSLKGKYVLVDFWAKWCGPCRQENPNVVRVYNKYKDKGFTVYGVSLDRKKEDWIQAIQQDGLTWTHVSDLKYWQSEAAKAYNISAIPFSVLVDPNGIIIDKNLRGPALEKRIGGLLGNK